MKIDTILLEASLKYLVAVLDMQNMTADDMASVQINNEGGCYLGIGLADRVSLTVEELAERLTNV
jgi:hypothetical protein